MAHRADLTQPEHFVFKDDGSFPKSRLPVLLYRQAVKSDGRDPAAIFEERFAANDWTNSWRNGVYSFTHYHSTSHEVLGVFGGSAKLRLGGSDGRTFDVNSGDVIAIPAGVAHQNLGASTDFGVELILAAADGICFVVFLANAQKPTATSLPCLCRTTIRFTATTGH